MAVPASKADLVSLAQRVESNITHAALDSLSKALREKQPVKQFVRSTLPAITAVLQRHFELLGGDLALFAGPSDEDGSDHESPSQSEADQALLDFGFEAFANLGHGDTLPSSQDPASLRNLIEEEARDRLRDAFEVTADGTGPQTPDERARSILRNIFDTITDAITHAAASYIERQRQLRARGAWDDFCGSRVAAFLQNEEEAAVRRARQKAEEARRAAAERERYDRIKKVDMGDVLAALLYGLTDEETDAILDDLEWHIQEKTKNAHESTPRTRKEGTGSDSREGRNEDRSEAAGDAERVPQKDGSLHNQATASISREGTFGHNLRDPENDITAEEMLIDLASDDGDSFEESEAAMPSLADCSVPRQEALKTSAEKIIQSAQSKATGSSSVGDATMNDMRFVQDIPQRPGLTSPTSASSEGRMAGVSSNQQPPPPTRPGTLPSTPSRFSTTPEHVRAALGPTPQPSQPFNFFPSSSSPSSPLPLRTSTTPEHIRDALGRTPTASPGFGMFSPTTLRPGPVPSASGGSAGNEHETQNRIRAFPPAAGNFNQPHRLPLGAQAHSTVGPIRFHERPSPLSTPYPAGRPFVTESGSPLASGRGRTLRRTPTPFSSKHARRGSTPELLLTGDIGEVASNLEPTQRRDTLAPRLSPQPEEDLLITPTRNASTLTLAHRPTPPRRPHPDAHESRESPYRRDRSIRRGSEGPSQHGDPVSVSHSSQPPSLHSSEHHRTGDVSIGPAQGFVFPADTTGEMGTYPSGHPSESHTIGSGLSRTLSAVRHPRRTLREVRSRHSRATLGADTFVAPVAESRQQAQRSQPHRSRSRGGMHQSQEDVSDSGIDRVRRRASQMLLALSDVASPNTAHDRPRTREGTSDRLRTREDTEDHLSSHEGTHEEEPRGLRRSLSAHNLLARLGRRPTASPRPSPQPDDPVPEGLGSSPPSMGPETAEAGSADIRQPHRPETYRPTGLPEPVARSNDGRLRAPTRQAAPARAQAPSGSSAYDIPLDSDEGIAAAGTTSKSSKAGSKGSKRDNGR